MKAVPRRLVVLGGGPAGVELGQVVRRLGGEVALVEGAERVLAREPAPLGEALGEALRRDGIELVLGIQATAASRDGEEFVLRLEDGRELRGDRLLVATGRRPRVEGIGLETVGIDANARRSPGRRPVRVGRATVGGRRHHRHLAADAVGEYQGEVVASNILGEPREAHYEAVPRVTYTDPQAAAVGATEAEFSATALLSEVAKTATYTHAYAKSNGFLTLLSDGEQPDRRLRAWPRGRGVDAAGDARDPRQGPARRAARHDPAVPELLGDPRRGAEGTPAPDRGATEHGRCGLAMSPPVAIITGASKGIGAGLVTGYRSAGYAVVGVALSFPSADRDESDYIPVAGDIADTQTARRAVDQARDRSGGSTR